MTRFIGPLLVSLFFSISGCKGKSWALKYSDNGWEYVPPEVIEKERQEVIDRGIVKNPVRIRMNDGNGAVKPVNEE